MKKNKKKRAQVSKESNKLVRKFGTILKVRVSSTELVEVLKAVQEKIEKKEHLFIVTPNPEIVTMTQSDSVLLGVLNSADISLPDGIGLVWASKVQAWKKQFSKRLAVFNNGNGPEIIDKRVSGIDTMENLIRIAANKAWKVFLLGGKEGVVTKSAMLLRRKYPQLSISWDSGPWLDKNGRPIDKKEEEREKETIRKINEFRPDILFVGFGAPKQEKWFTTNSNKIQTYVTMVVGGSLDYISGNIPRAPLWMRENGFEWLFRLIIEPWRIVRQLSLLKFAWLVLKGD